MQVLGPMEEQALRSLMTLDVRASGPALGSALGSALVSAGGVLLEKLSSWAGTLCLGHTYLPMFKQHLPSLPRTLWTSAHR